MERHKYCKSLFKYLFMKRISYLLLFFIIIFLSGCSVVEGIFKAGMWWAFILVFGLVFIVAWIYLKTKKK